MTEMGVDLLMLSCLSEWNTSNERTERASELDVARARDRLILLFNFVLHSL